MASQLKSLAHFSHLPVLPESSRLDPLGYSGSIEGSAGKQQCAPGCWASRIECLWKLAALSKHMVIGQEDGASPSPLLLLRAPSGRSPGQLGFVPTIYSPAQTRTAAISVFLLLLRQGEGRESSPSKNITGEKYHSAEPHPRSVSFSRLRPRAPTYLTAALRAPSGCGSSLACLQPLGPQGERMELEKLRPREGWLQ